MLDKYHLMLSFLQQMWVHDSGLTTMYEKLEKKEVKEIPSADLVHIVELVLKNNFEFDS